MTESCGSWPELITVEDGYRETAESWKTVLRDLKRRGMRPPVVAAGDGASSGTSWASSEAARS